MMSNTAAVVSKIKTLSFNCQSLKPKLNEIVDRLIHKQIDVACFSETWLNDVDRILFPGYSIYRVDRQSGDHGGVAIVVKSNIKHRQIPPVKTSVIENVAIVVDTPYGGITFVSAYFPGSDQSSATMKLFKRDIRSLTSIKDSYYVCGDLNSKHRLWNNLKANAAGLIVYNELLSRPFNVLHSPTPTYYPPQRGRNPSNIDVVLTNGFHATSQVSSADDLISDHRAIEFSIDCDVNYKRHAKRFRFDLADWNVFKDSVSEKIDLNVQLDSINDIDEAILKLTSICNESMDLAIPKCPAKTFKFELTPEILDLIALKNSVKRRVQRSVQRDSTFVNFLSRKIERKIDELRNKRFNDDIGSWNYASKKFWQVTKFIKNKSNNIPPIKDASGKFLFSNQEKADEIAKVFHSSHVLTESMHDEQTEQLVAASVECIENTPVDRSELSSLFVTPKEIHNVIRRLKSKKAAGDDGIHNRIIKQLPKKAIIMLTKIFNACLKLSYFPAKWKIARVIPVPKPNKSLSSAASFRPISLLSSFSKIFERLLLQRIQLHVDGNHIIPDEQFGFRQKHSTTHQLLRVVKHVKSEFVLKRSTGMVFLDIEKAFDSLWHDGLLHKLLKYKFPLTLIKMIKSFLSGRQFFVFLFDGKSKMFDVPAGAPQGSCLSPSLYNIYISDLKVPGDCKLAQFADDTGVLRSDDNPKVISTRLQESVVQIIAFFKKWKIKINASKTEAIFFTRRRAKRFHRVRKLRFDDIVIDWSKKLKYLGLILDRKLLFDEHIKYSNERAQKYIMILYSLINRRSQLSLRNKLLIYKSIIRSILFYACPVWGTCAKTHLKKLQVTQNKCLKMIYNLPFHYSTYKLHKKANIKTITESIANQSKKFLLNCHFSSNPLIYTLPV